MGTDSLVTSRKLLQWLQVSGIIIILSSKKPIPLLSIRDITYGQGIVLERVVWPWDHINLVVPLHQIIQCCGNKTGKILRMCRMQGWADKLGKGDIQK